MRESRIGTFPITFFLLNPTVMVLKWFLMILMFNLEMSIFRIEANLDVGLSTQARNAEAEVVFRTDQEKLEFKRAKPEEIESYIENMAIEIAKRKSMKVGS